MMLARLPRIKRGAWKPGLQPDLSLLLMVILAFEVIVRGLDYAGGDRDDVTQSLTVVEDAMPIQMWGVLCLIGGGMFLFGILSRRFTPTIFGAVSIMGIYGALAFGLFLRMAERGWPWDGYRTPLMFSVFAIFFAIYAFSAYLKRSAVRVERQLKEGGTASSIKEE